MKVNVSVVSRVLSSDHFTPTEMALKLKGFVGKTLTPEVDPTMLVADFKAYLASQLGTVTLNAKYAVELDDIELTNNQTLAAGGMKDGCAVKFRVILTL